jgi:Helix-turn-helix domain
VEDALVVAIPHALLDGIRALVSAAVRDELSQLPHQADGFLDVGGAAAYLASTQGAIRSLVKRNAIPYHKAPNGRLLFDRSELNHWARAG